MLFRSIFAGVDFTAVGVAYGFQSTIETDAFLYFSNVPLARVPDRDYGIKQGFWVGAYLKTNATAGTMIPLMQDLIPPSGTVNVLPTFGKRGAMLYVTNEDTTNPIRIVWARQNVATGKLGSTGVLGQLGFPI